MRSMLAKPTEANQFLAEHIARLQTSYRQLLGRNLLPENLSGVAAARAIWEAPFVVVSHDTSADPIFNYGNRTALELFAMGWEEFTRLPSRHSAELPNRDERARLLAMVSARGFAEGYSGIRIAKTGQRFEIQNGTVWNVSFPDGSPAGQAATFRDWNYL